MQLTPGRNRARAASHRDFQHKAAKTRRREAGNKESRKGGSLGFFYRRERRDWWASAASDLAVEQLFNVIIAMTASATIAMSTLSCVLSPLDTA